MYYDWSIGTQDTIQLYTATYQVVLILESIVQVGDPSPIPKYEYIPLLHKTSSLQTALAYIARRCIVKYHRLRHHLTLPKGEHAVILFRDLCVRENYQKEENRTEHERSRSQQSKLVLNRSVGKHAVNLKVCINCLYIMSQLNGSKYKLSSGDCGSW